MGKTLGQFLADKLGGGSSVFASTDTPTAAQIEPKLDGDNCPPIGQGNIIPPDAAEQIANRAQAGVHQFGAKQATENAFKAVCGPRSRAPSFGPS
jgi:hypothetical protein